MYVHNLLQGSKACYFTISIQCSTSKHLYKPNTEHQQVHRHIRGMYEMYTTPSRPNIRKRKHTKNKIKLYTRSSC